jgi:hypothetical protein
MRVVILLCLLTTGCMVDGRRWEWQPVDVEVRCPGGRISEERRSTDVIAGRTRNTVVRTNACLD